MADNAPLLSDSELFEGSEVPDVAMVDTLAAPAAPPPNNYQDTVQLQQEKQQSDNNAKRKSDGVEPPPKVAATGAGRSERGGPPRSEASGTRKSFDERRREAMDASRAKNRNCRILDKKGGEAGGAEPRQDGLAAEEEEDEEEEVQFTDEQLAELLGHGPAQSSLHVAMAGEARYRIPRKPESEYVFKTASVMGRPAPARVAHPPGDMPSGHEKKAPSKEAWLVITLEDTKGDQSMPCTMDDIALSVRAAAAQLKPELAIPRELTVQGERKGGRLILQHQDIVRFIEEYPVLIVLDKDGKKYIANTRLVNKLAQGKLRATETEKKISHNFIIRPATEWLERNNRMEMENIKFELSKRGVDVVSYNTQTSKEAGTTDISVIHVNLIPKACPNQPRMFDWTTINIIYPPIRLEKNAMGDVRAAPDGQSVRCILCTDRNCAEKLHICKKCLRPNEGEKCICMMREDRQTRPEKGGGKGKGGKRLTPTEEANRRYGVMKANSSSEKELCQDWANGYCRFGAGCEKTHDPTKAGQCSKKGKCNRKYCPYKHEESQA